MSRIDVFVLWILGGFSIERFFSHSSMYCNPFFESIIPFETRKCPLPLSFQCFAITFFAARLYLFLH